MTDHPSSDPYEKDRRIAFLEDRMGQVLMRVRAVKPGMPCYGLAQAIADTLDPPQVPDDFDLSDALEGE